LISSNRDEKTNGATDWAYCAGTPQKISSSPALRRTVLQLDYRACSRTPNTGHNGSTRAPANGRRGQRCSKGKPIGLISTARFPLHRRLGPEAHLGEVTASIWKISATF